MLYAFYKRYGTTPCTLLFYFVSKGVCENALSEMAFAAF
jgi:hypothetical protein